MGQRANYILIEQNQVTIHYHHWRANSIFSDLYLGEKSFIKFIRTCKINEVLLDEVWMEGCVVIDVPNRVVHFWSLEFEVTSYVNKDLKELKRKWPGWTMNLAYNRMYDIEKVLKIDYISQQELRPLCEITLEEIANEEPADYVTATIVVKNESGLHIVKTTFSIDEVLNLGTIVLPTLLNRPESVLAREDDYETGGFDLLIIDTVNSGLFISSCEFGLWEQCYYKWPGYTFQMGDHGFVGALRMAGVDADSIIMPAEVARERFEDMIRRSPDFDPRSLAKTLIEDMGSYVQFNPDFFDNPKPTEPRQGRIKGFWKWLWT